MGEKTLMLGVAYSHDCGRLRYLGVRVNADEHRHVDRVQLKREAARNCDLVEPDSLSNACRPVPGAAFIAGGNPSAGKFYWPERLHATT